MLILALLNCLALGFAFLLWRSLGTRYRGYFLGGAAFPLLAAALGGSLSGQLQLWSTPWIDLGGFLLRGWLLIAILCGAGLCGLLSHYAQKGNPPPDKKS